MIKKANDAGAVRTPVPAQESAAPSPTATPAVAEKAGPRGDDFGAKAEQKASSDLIQTTFAATTAGPVANPSLMAGPMGARFAKAPSGGRASAARANELANLAASDPQKALGLLQTLVGSPPDPAAVKKLQAGLAPGALSSMKLGLAGAGEGRIAFVGKTGNLELREVRPDAARGLLAEIKTADRELKADSHDLRAALMRTSATASNPGNVIQSFEAFSYPVDMPKSMAEPGFLAAVRDRGNYIPERSAVQDRLIDSKGSAVQGMSDVLANDPPVVYTLRGNTAAGKTRSLASVGDFMSEAGRSYFKNNSDATLNPDPVKPQLIAASGGKVASQSVHFEAAKVVNDTVADRAKADPKLSLVLDGRNTSAAGFAGEIARAEKLGKQVRLLDVDASLETSCVGVLGRKPGGEDPCVPFAVVAQGFREARSERAETLQIAARSDAVTHLDVFATADDGAKIHLASKRNGNLEVLNETGLKAIVGDERTLNAEVSRVANLVIDDSFISKFTASLSGGYKDKVVSDLSAYKGKTLEQALGAHFAKLE